LQDKAQKLKPDELDAFLIHTLQDSNSFGKASPSVIKSAAGYLKQVMMPQSTSDWEACDCDG
jgi:hypothetical protein